MANCGSNVGKDYLIYYLVSADCQTIPTIGEMKRLGGFTTKSWDLGTNPTTSTTDAYDYQVNTATVKSFTTSGSFNSIDDETQLNQQDFVNFAFNHVAQGFDQPKLWIGLTDGEIEEVIDYMNIDTISHGAPTDGDRTYDISLSHGGELNPQYTAL